MKKKLLPLVTIVIMTFFGACNNEELLPEANSETQQSQTIKLTASMPEKPNTRVGLERKMDNVIELTWQDGDELQLAFVKEGATTIKQTVEVNNISSDRKSAQFDVTLPTGFETGNFNLYGVYGGGELSVLGDKATVKLPVNPGSATSLEDIESRKDVMLHFASKNINATNPEVSVLFEHLGSLISITLMNTGTESLDLQEAKLVEDNSANTQWAYNNGEGGKTFDLESGAFQNPESAANWISFEAGVNTLAAGKSITFWGWYPILPEKGWPELKLVLEDANNNVKTSSNNKEAKTPTAGKSYYFYADWDGSQLNFVQTVYVETMGTLGTLLSDTQKASIKKLILKGQLNQDDFEVLKLDMPNLTYIDLKDVTVEDNKIPDNAFGKEYNKPGTVNTKITTVVLPDNLETIGYAAFSDCANLTTITPLPSGLKRIEDWAFWNCKKLVGELELPAGLTFLGVRAFQNAQLSGILTIPIGIKAIPHSVFYLNQFTDIVFHDEITSIGNSAFIRCQKVTGTLVIPNSVTTISDKAFAVCDGITGLDLGDNVQTIGTIAFENCKLISGKVVFPETLTAIANKGFIGCVNVDAFQFKSTTPITYTSEMLPIGIPVEVPASAVADYIAAWGESRHDITAIP
ncbi:MAG: leucine-rich repeat protein [Dysgonamonadaceae bacterium]|nr:leucine-rich repeat protein [Dysgonamonadaceae bacterium]